MLGAVRVSVGSLEPLIQEIGQKYGVDPNLIKAHIKQESNWDINASRYEAHKGDSSWGLMQLLLATARQVLGNSSLTTSDLTNPRINIEAGTKLIAQNLRRYRGDIPAAVAAYNAGSARVNPKTGKYNNQDYVDKVMANYQMYQTMGPLATYIPTAVSDVGVYALMGAMIFGMVYVAGGTKQTSSSTAGV